jgi:hypothetical protein
VPLELKLSSAMLFDTEISLSKDKDERPIVDIFQKQIYKWR